MKDAEPFLPTYFSLLENLTHPNSHLSLGFLESNSQDHTFDYLQKRLPTLKKAYAAVTLIKRDYSVKWPTHLPRYAPEIQEHRRSIMAKSRNYLLSKALQDEDWVLWLDVDLVDYPTDCIAQFLETGKNILHPNCVIIPGGRSFDLNAWTDQGTRFMHDLRGGPDLTPIQSVGGTMLFINADLHREGLIFPPFGYGLAHPYSRNNTSRKGEFETEGLALLAHDMGETCWGMPNLEIRHFDH